MVWSRRVRVIGRGVGDMWFRRWGFTFDYAGPYTHDEHAQDLAGARSAHAMFSSAGLATSRLCNHMSWHPFMTLHLHVRAAPFWRSGHLEAPPQPSYLECAQRHA